jgi:hypothetical protein
MTQATTWTEVLEGEGQEGTAEPHMDSPFNIAQNHVRCLKSDKTNKLAHHVFTE